MSGKKADIFGGRVLRRGPSVDVGHKRLAG
jgi:hypothetical protein